jgi:hypothetical protein
MKVYHDGTNYEIRRLFFPVDCTAIDDSATISAAVLYIYTDSITNTDDDGDDWANVVGETTQADPTTLATGDYNDCGAVDNPTEGATRIDYSAITAAGYTTWTLNATGRGWIKKSGSGADAYTRLGLREGHDCIDSALASSTLNEFAVRCSEYANTASDPYLKVTYTVSTTWIPRVIIIQ